MISIDGNKVGMKGEYKISIMRGDTGLVEETPWFDNLILNSGLDILGDDSGIVPYVATYLKVGTGTSTPVVTQTKLDSFLAGANLLALPNSSSGSPNYNRIITNIYPFAQGAVVGNITELAVSPIQDSQSICFSRSLILDNTGTPTSITVNAIDQLTVYYKLIVVPNLSDFTGSFVLDGVTYNYTGRISDAANFYVNAGNLAPYYFRRLFYVYGYSDDATLGPATGGPNASRGVTIDRISQPEPYVLGSYTGRSTATFAANNTNNFPIKLFYMFFAYGLNQYQILLDKAIPKSNTNELTFKIGFSWGRA